MPSLPGSENLKWHWGKNNFHWKESPFQILPGDHLAKLLGGNAGNVLRTENGHALPEKISLSCSPNPMLS